ASRRCRAPGTLFRNRAPDLKTPDISVRALRMSRQGLLPRSKSSRSRGRPKRALNLPAGITAPLVRKEGAMLAVGTILHPTDFSERSQYAFAVACALARDYGARLVVVHVVQVPTIVYGEGVLPV